MAFGFYTAFTVDHTKVPNTDQTNFPVGIIDSTGLARLKTVGNGGHVQNSNGYDIRPYSDAGLTSALTYELVFYDAATGKIEMWVNIPTLTTATDTTIYLAYGDSGISTDGSSTGTWNTNFKGVWHLKDGSTLSYADSTSTGATGTADSGTPSASVGQIDGGMTTVATDRVNVGNPGSAFSIGSAITVSTWSKFTVNTAVGNANLIARWGANNAYALSTSFPNGGTYSFFIKVGGVNKSAGASANAYNDGAWHLVHGVFNGSNVLLYVDGSLAVTGTATAGPIDTPVQSVTFNNYGNATTQGYIGSMDEARISNVARLADWIKTEYNNQNSPSTFYTVGTEQATSIIAFDAAANSGDQASANTYSGSASWSGTNRMLAIDVSLLGPSTTVTSMTYGGAACTFVGSKSTVTSLGSVEQWRICSSDPGAPGTGANTLVVNLSGTIEFSVEWVSYTGVNQSSPTEAFNSNQATNTGSATDASVVVTSTTDQCWIHAAVVANDTSITANQTTRNNISGTLGSGANEDNNAPVSPAGSTTMSYSGMGITTTWAIAGYAIRPLGSSSGLTLQGFLALLGLGA